MGAVLLCDGFESGFGDGGRLNDLEVEHADAEEIGAVLETPLKRLSRMDGASSMTAGLAFLASALRSIVSVSAQTVAGWLAANSATAAMKTPSTRFMPSRIGRKRLFDKLRVTKGVGNVPVLFRTLNLSS